MTKTTLAIAAALVAGFTPPNSIGGGTPAPSATIANCPQHDLAGRVTCYDIDVPENPKNPEGRHISLEVMVLEARAEEPEGDPLFVIPGGPGQSATRSAGPRAYFAQVFDAVRETRDIVLIAPRGTAGSGELRLDPSNDAIFASLDTVIPPEWARAARDRLAAEADLTQYTTSRIVDDLDATRRALGYERLNLYGTSYGTRVAQCYAARYPNRVRAMILKSPLPLDVPVPLTYTSGADRALRKLFTLCAGDTNCTDAHPNLKDRFETLMANLRAQPVRVTAKHPFSKEPVEITIDDTAFGYLIRNLLMSAAGGPTALSVIDAATQGDFSNAVALMSRLRAAYATELAGGMALSVIATEDIPRVTDAALAAETQAGFLGGAVARGMLEAARDWPRGNAPADVFAPLQGDTPALIVTGDLDPATPPEFANRIAAGLSNARVVVFPGGAHSASNFAGLDVIISTFIETADPWAVDVTAAETSRPLPLAGR